MGKKRSYIKRMVRTNGYDPKMMASCYGKVKRYREDAREHAKNLGLVAYLCTYCDGWHVGHKTKANNWKAYVKDKR